MRSSYYENAIRQELAKLGRSEVEPRWVEAYMRLEHPTLNGVHHRTFRREVKIAVECIDASTAEENEGLARSFGL